MKRLFVYGSLMRGQQHHGELAGARWLGQARTSSGYTLVRYGEYPALVSMGSGRVYGELYGVSDGLLERLDELEGCPELYQRGHVRLDDASLALVYVIEPGRARGLPEVARGRWTGPRGGG